MTDTPKDKTPSKFVTIATLGRAQGLRGEVRATVFLENPLDIKRYNPLLASDGRKLSVSKIRPAKNVYVMTLKEITERTDAEALNGLELKIERTRLPKLDDEEDFYHEDLIGLKAESLGGTYYGKIAAIHNFGAGDIIELRGGAAKGSTMVPFTKAAVPHVDIEQSLITLDEAAAGLLHDPDEDFDEGRDEDRN